MKRCLPSGKSNNSSRVSASVQSRQLLALNSTTKSNPSCASYLRSWPTGVTLRTCTCNNLQLRRYMPKNPRKSSLQIICTYKESSYSGHVSYALGKTKEQTKQRLSK